MECGIGGRLDGTNFVERPVCTAITSIGLDHEKILGETIEAISWEKAGIMKENVPCVLGPSCNTKSIETKAVEVGNELIRVPKLDTYSEENDMIAFNVLNLLLNDVQPDIMPYL